MCGGKFLTKINLIHAKTKLLNFILLSLEIEAPKKSSTFDIENLLEMEKKETLFTSYYRCGDGMNSPHKVCGQNILKGINLHVNIGMKKVLENVLFCLRECCATVRRHTTLSACMWWG